MLFFFFQAEDGIRDHCVTGVQTCALPIWVRWVRGGICHRWLRGQSACSPDKRAGHERSEERRVGKECRSRWAPYHEKKKREEGGEEDAVRTTERERSYKVRRRAAADARGA